MKDLQVINEQEVLGKNFRVYGTIENPLFLAKDVASWIEHSNVSQMISDSELDESELTKDFIEISYAYGNGFRSRRQESLFLTEDGLYEVLMQSRKPIAKQFKKEVKKILKQIRMTGGYIPVKEEETDAEIMAKALLIAQSTIENKNKRINELEDEVKVLEPKAEVYDAFVEKEATFGFRELRKELESALGKSIKETELKEIIRSKGWIGSTVKALAYAIRNGYMVSKDIEDKFGLPRVQDRFTMKAREELLKHFKGIN